MCVSVCCVERDKGTKDPRWSEAGIGSEKWEQGGQSLSHIYKFIDNFYLINKFLGAFYVF